MRRLSAVLLVGRAANAPFDWWWADPAAVEGVRTCRAWAESLGDTCCD